MFLKTLLEVINGETLASSNLFQSRENYEDDGTTSEHIFHATSGYINGFR